LSPRRHQEIVATVSDYLFQNNITLTTFVRNGNKIDLILQMVLEDSKKLRAVQMDLKPGSKSFFWTKTPTKKNLKWTLAPAKNNRRPGK
jgi:hypothetical protein